MTKQEGWVISVEIKKLKRLLFMQKIVLLLQISALIVQVSSLLKH